MCDHKYIKLGYLMIYDGDEFCPSSADRPEEHIRGAYSGHTCVTDSVIVYQCNRCGKIKLSNGVLESL